MNASVTLTQKELSDFLLNVAVARPVFIWGPPGIGKSALVQGFANEVGLPCVSLLGSQLAPEDLIGVPQIVDGCSRFCPPVSIARTMPYCLFLDELNACSHEVQKAFYSLIHERRIGEYVLPEGSVVVGAGNRAQDSAIVKPMSSALINRMIHVHLKVSHRDWLEWAGANNIHPLVVHYIQNRPDHLWVQPPKHEETFSSPRSWHMLSDDEHARHWAEANRALIAARVAERLGAEGQRRFDACHNWIEQREVGGRSCWLHRKGAAPSTCGPVVIPGSRGAFSYLVLPIGAGERSCHSLAHGAGRKWARTDSRARLEKRFTAKDLTRTDLGSHVICEDRELLFEEAPQAYKNITVVIDDLVREGLIQIVALLRPVVTYKVRR